VKVTDHIGIHCARLEVAGHSSLYVCGALVPFLSAILRFAYGHILSATNFTSVIATRANVDT